MKQLSYISTLLKLGAKWWCMWCVSRTRQFNSEEQFQMPIP
jgi:hypothetical protein